MRKRLIYRCDDVGYTLAYDLGLFRVLDAGIGCSADVMLDAPHAVEALQWLKSRPWLSIGWHRHLWESPVLPREQVPHMVDEEGRFIWRHRHPERMAEVPYEEAFAEFEAEACLCYRILGRYPDIAGTRDRDIPLERAFEDVLKKYRIPHNCFYNHPGTPSERPAAKEWQHLNFISVAVTGAVGVEKGYDLKYVEEYDPETTYKSLRWTDKEEIYLYGWHPGYCDDHILAESRCNIHRVKELQAALSPGFSQWIIENQVELINVRDALYGTHEFQDHLKAVGSPLWIGNGKK